MPNLKTFVGDALKEECSSVLDDIDCYSVEQFLKEFDSIKACNPENEQKLNLIRCAAIARYKPVVRSGQYLCQRCLKNVKMLPTGFVRLDQRLNGGFYTNEVIELFGPAGKGKTQFALHLSSFTCLKQRLAVAYLDSSNSFSTQRFTEISKKFGATHEVVSRMLKKVLVIPCHDIFKLQDILQEIMTHKKSKSDELLANVKLLVIDSIFPLLSPVIGPKSSEGFAIMNSLSLVLRKLAKECLLTVMMVNATVTGETSQGLPKGALGVQWHQVADRRILVNGYDEQHDPPFNIQVISHCT